MGSSSAEHIWVGMSARRVRDAWLNPVSAKEIQAWFMRVLSQWWDSHSGAGPSLSEVASKHAGFVNPVFPPLKPGVLYL